MRTFMRSFLTLSLALVLMACPAAATEIFNKPKKNDALPEAPVIQNMSPRNLPEAAPTMQTIEKAAPPAASAPEETIESFSRRYNENCLKKQNDVLKGDDLRMLCACTSSKLQEKMTVGEIRQMATDTPEGQVQRNRMVIDVYAPCMEYPSRALLMSRCADYKTSLEKTPQGQALNGEAICSCLAQNMAAYVAVNAQAILTKKLAVSPSDMDPLGAFLNSPEYQAQVNSTFASCVQGQGALKQQ